MENRSAYFIGLWSSILVSIEVLMFAIFLIFGFWADTTMLSFAVCWLLAPSFLAMMLSLHYTTKEELKIWSHLGVLISVVYCVLIFISYYGQLAIVRTNSLQFTPEVLKLLIYKPGSFLFALNMMGYAIMCLAMLLMALTFSNKEDGQRGLRTLFLINGVFFFSSIIFPLLPIPFAEVEQETSNFGAIAMVFWCVIFLPLSVRVIKYFQYKIAQSKEK